MSLSEKPIKVKVNKLKSDSTNQSNYYQLLHYIEKIISKNKRTSNGSIRKMKHLNIYVENENKTLKLFSEDVAENNPAKRFYTVDQNTVFQTVKTKKFHLYENIERGQLAKLHIDIDIKKEDLKEDIDFDDVLNQCIDSINKELLEYKIIQPEIIILSSCREDKFLHT